MEKQISNKLPDDDSLSITTRALVQGLRLLHYLIVVFVVFAWAFPSPSVWLTHLIFVPLMILQWKLNRDMCLLSNIEQALLGRGFYPEQGEGEFVKSLLAKVMDPLPSDEVIGLGLYALCALSWCASLFRYLT